MTVHLNSQNQQMLITQQLKAAQCRVEKLQQQLAPREADNEKENQTQQQQQQQTQDPSKIINNLNNLAAYNLYANESLSKDQKQTAFQSLQPQNNNPQKPDILPQISQAQAEIQEHEKRLSNKKPDQTYLKQIPEEVKQDPLFKQLPQDLKDRPDIGDLMKTVEPEALLDPQKAVDALVEQALMGNKKAFIKLNDYSKNPFEKLQENAGKGIDQVIAGAEGRPQVLEMIASTPTERSGEAATKLLHLTDRNPRAQEAFEGLLKKGAINFTKVASEAKDKDPAQTASAINTLMKRGNLSKEDRMGGVNILGEIAKESPTGAGSKEAAKGLTQAVHSEPVEIATRAAQMLKEAALNGNGHALSGLQKLSKDNNPSRAQLALSELGEIAKSGSASAQEGMETIRSVAQDPGTNGKVRNNAVSLLGNIASEGGSTSKEAVNTLSNIAVNKTNPSNINAFNQIGKLNNSTTGSMNTGANPRGQNNLSDTETYQKVMATQQQLNTFAGQTPNMLQMFGTQMMQFS